MLAQHWIAFITTHKCFDDLHKCLGKDIVAAMVANMLHGDIIDPSPCATIK